jgi:hypothetical protein
LKLGQELDLFWRAAARANGDLRGHAGVVGSLKGSQQTESKKLAKPPILPVPKLLDKRLRCE